MAEVRVIEQGFDPGAEIAAFAAAHLDAGGISSFLGQVRADGDVEALELSHYPPLTQPGMAALAAEAARRWPLDGLLVLHRVGTLAPGDSIVLVVAAARHRRDAMVAVDFMMDHLKSEAFFWKRERRGGTWRWIEPRGEDRRDLARWQI